ncbi:zinc finger C3H domain-containing protein [Vairimorpha necatrix]|uniref:Zinc finger C3H domain-containing protein n=1 Tax=Vairimorpha necatrix TaxID=6039 RepID=A0AAX4JBN8_9MICR
MVELEDCYFFLYSECKLKERCRFRHNQLSKDNLILCKNWSKNKKCRMDCPLRHSLYHVVKQRSDTMCYWEDKGGCTKYRCEFKHIDPNKDLWKDPKVKLLTEIIENKTRHKISNNNISKDNNINDSAIIDDNNKDNNINDSAIIDDNNKDSGIIDNSNKDNNTTNTITANNTTNTITANNIINDNNNCVTLSDAQIIVNKSVSNLESTQEEINEFNQTKNKPIETSPFVEAEEETDKDISTLNNEEIDRPNKTHLEKNINNPEKQENLKRTLENDEAVKKLKTEKNLPEDKILNMDLNIDIEGLDEEIEELEKLLNNN